MDEMHAYPTDDIADHVFDGACQCDFTVQEVIWDDEPDVTYLLVLHQPVRKDDDRRTGCQATRRGQQRLRHFARGSTRCRRCARRIHPRRRRLRTMQRGTVVMGLLQAPADRPVLHALPPNRPTRRARIASTQLSGALDWFTVRGETPDGEGGFFEADDDPNPYRADA